MDNRLAMALAVAGGYVLGRTKKGKLALGLGGMAIGKRLNLSPRALARLASEQLNNPQLKEVGDQVREDLRGVGKAATDAVVTRRLDSLADTLHQRTLNVQDQLSGAVPEEARLDKGLGADDQAEEEEAHEEEEEEAHEEEEETAHEEEEETAGTQDRAEGTRADDDGPEKRRPAARTRKTAGKPVGKTATTARRTAPGKAPAAKKRTAERTTAARGTSGRAKGGEGRG